MLKEKGVIVRLGIIVLGTSIFQIVALKLGAFPDLKGIYSNLYFLFFLTTSIVGIYFLLKGIFKKNSN
ncbi:MAG: hypothetical protein JJE53_00355 [Candidatus Pacebacteria bacterium]|nr:hypothetical protein [Candidatus Paceibacterota bacterium]